MPYYPVGAVVEAQRRRIARKIAEYIAKGEEPPKRLIVDYIRAGGELSFLRERVKRILAKRKRVKKKEKIEKSKKYEEKKLHVDEKI